jgi:uncharacterized protein
MTKYLNSENIKYTLANLSQLVFEVTDACNLKCKYCGYGEFYHYYDKREGKMLSTDKATRIIDYLATCWNSERNVSAKQIVFISFYGGEPLLNMPFIKTIVDYVENCLQCSRCRFIFSMTTNAMLLDRYMDYLYDHNLNLLISLDGNAENTGYRVDQAGHPAFNRIVQNVDRLRDKYPDYFEKSVNFNAVLHNKNSVETIYRFFKVRYNKIPSIAELNNVGIRKDKQAAFYEAYRNTNESLHQSEHYEEIERDMFIQSSTYKSVTMFLHKYSGFVFHDYTDLLFDRSEKKQLPTGTCVPFSKKMFVTVNGKILPCERIGHQFALGEVTDTEVRLDVEAIATKYNSYFAKFEKQCSACKNIKSCIQCIYNVADPDGKPVCHGFMSEEAFHHYVNTQMYFLEKHPEDYQKIMKEVIVL